MRLSTARDLAAACAQLARQCDVMAAIAARVPPPPLRDFTADFAGLSKIVVGQQLSAQSAAAIWARVAGAVVPFDAATLDRHDDAALGALGLSRAKVRTLRAISTTVSGEGLDFQKLNCKSDPAIIARLTQIHGIGPWTADIYLLFALRRADAFAAGDLALQIAAQRVFGLPSRPSAAALESLAERWRPLRAAAARLLWADYARQQAEWRARESVEENLQAPATSAGADLKKRPRSEAARKPSQN